MDVSLPLYYAFWFLGNYYFNLYNKLASMEAGGFAGGMLVTISVAQLAVRAVEARLKDPVRVFFLFTPALTQRQVAHEAVRSG